MNILICDDSKEETDNLAAMLGASGFDTNVIIFTDAQKALDYVNTGGELQYSESTPANVRSAVDCCFLDIIMPEMNGIELAKKLRERRFAGEIVFLTSSNDFAHESYRVKAYNYLLKPPTLENVRNILNALENEHKTVEQKGLMVKIYGKSRFIPYRTISHIEIIIHTVYIRLINGDEIKVYSTLAEIAPRLLSDKRFMQCHRSYIVNVNDIENIMEKQIIMRNGAKIPISKGFSQIKEEMVERIFERDR